MPLVDGEVRVDADGLRPGRGFRGRVVLVVLVGLVVVRAAGGGSEHGVGG